MLARSRLGFVNASARVDERQPQSAKYDEEKWGLLLPGAPEPRLTLLRRQGFDRYFKPPYAA